MENSQNVKSMTQKKKSHHTKGLTVVGNYKSCGWGRERCDREGHAVFLRPRVDSAIMGSASAGISTSSTKLKMISTFCLRLPPLFIASLAVFVQRADWTHDMKVRIGNAVVLLVGRMNSKVHHHPSAHKVLQQN